MKLKRIFFYGCLILFLLSCGTTKYVPINDDQLKANLKKHISTLASDDFAGRETGTPGEKKASEYIIKEFKKAGLKPKGENGFLQPFQFTAGAEFGSSTQLIVNSNIYVPGVDFFPLPYSSNAVVTNYTSKMQYGITDVLNKRDDYKGKLNIAKRIFLIETGTPDGNDPHGKFGDWTDLRKKIDLAVSHGAAGIIFINSDTTIDDPKPDWKKHISPSTIPVIFAGPKAARVLKDSVVTNCTIGTEIIKIEKTGNNVIGFINNKSNQTVVIGAHYDHLGMGDDGSLYRGAPAIHNGADDNASGTAALIELAKYARDPAFKKSNYLFIAFSGEEKGLLGSNYFVKHPTIDLSLVNYMINMDMLGRLKEEKVLIINGTGTAERWKGIIDSAKVDDLKIKETDSGVGPSDHTSFYLQNIPVLHFFSGTHSDYHKPTDDEDKINYEGELLIINSIKNIMKNLDGSSKLVFLKTKNDSNEDAPRFKVTLGVVPDYSFEGDGMRIDGVTEGRPAANAGLQSGDVVIQLGENKVVDMTSYMKALGKFNKGDTTKVKVKRGNQEVEKDITF
jgi:aminopeptidase YwaD